MQTIRQRRGMGTMIRIAAVAGVALALPQSARSQQRTAVATFQPLAHLAAPVEPTPLGSGADSAQARITLTKTALMTAAGGAAGGLIGLLAGVTIGWPLTEAGALFAPGILGAVGLVAGYTAGGAMMARRATTLDGDGPSFGSVLSASLLGDMGGVYLSSQFSRLVTDDEPWGSIAVFIATHAVITSVGALRQARR
jgi:hypothetical protein